MNRIIKEFDETFTEEFLKCRIGQNDLIIRLFRYFLIKHLEGFAAREVKLMKLVKESEKCLNEGILELEKFKVMFSINKPQKRSEKNEEESRGRSPLHGSEETSPSKDEDG